ncbi:MAG TPA: DUF5666 domain-containing protein [Candidatus Thiothrix moscowensis]|uniref:DUF5666 domain-containing protein n=1 Tax=unclassified Thiothrix TaxID=2636184 RepID=UPI0025FE6FA8|nr:MULTISPECIES: DUF5666 domain-containing protein [unclassified Thiothrix]HRJ51594.1 DUF5666 domain-containing protein [Candidatus Thiothrix moscowensis]HRJ91909.1 DUF5666 domain-containing protein [Candidatus Thiothrix moscowensis]
MKAMTTLLATALLLILAACGGGGGLTVANGGIGGTGISTGPITAFGSIFVNGVKYDVDSASFTRNGVAASGQNEYFLGEYITVEGNVNADGVTGKASAVHFSRGLQGTVTAVSADSVDGKSLWVLGQVVKTNALTVFERFKLLADLKLGNVVEVSGIRDANGELVATSIRLLQVRYVPGETLEVKGTIGSVDTTNQTFTLSNLIVDYSPAVLQGFPSGIPQAGQYVEAESQQALQGSRMIASEVERKDAGITFKEGTEVEVEGVITRFVSRSDFSVNGVAVTTNASTRFEGGTASNLALNALVEIEGNANAAGVIVAEKVEIKQSDSSDIDELEGNITAIDPTAQTFRLGIYTVSVNTSTLWEDESDADIPQMNFSHLNIGDYLEIKGKTIGTNKLLALRIKREDPDD